MPAPARLSERYELRKVLDQGGMGVVYRAYDTVIKREVALKTIRETPTEAALQLFYKECDVLKQLSHPNIVEIFDLGEIEIEGKTYPCFVMPLLPGATLHRLLRDSPHRLTVERAVDIMLQACRGLQAAHERNLVHRDIKPSNLFVMPDDAVKIIDFGVAHMVDVHSSTVPKGTLLYMAPEILQRKPPSPLSDIFSLAVVCYEVLTRRRPFDRPAEGEVIDAILRHIPPPASDLNPAVSQALSRVIHKGLAKQPWHRFSSAREFGECLNKALHNQPIELFAPARIQPRIQRAQAAFEQGDHQFAAEILGELEAEGHIDPAMGLLRQQIDRAVRQKMVAQLLEAARTRIQNEEYPLALQKIQEVLELDPSNAQALGLRTSIQNRLTVQKIDDWIRLAQQHLDNRAYSHAREALQKVLQLRAHESRAEQMLAEVDRQEQEYLRVQRQKQQLYSSALDAWQDGEISSALSKIEQVLELDRLAPDTSPERAASYRNLFNQVRTEHDAIQQSYAEARKCLTDKNFQRALELCREVLARRPGHALIQALQFEIEERQRQALSARIVEVDRQVEAEPDLDRRASILEQALADYPGEPHFQKALRLTQDRRDLVNSLVAKAQLHEERGQFSEALAQWEILGNVYEQYPGLQFEKERAAKRRDEQARAEAKALWVDRVSRLLESGNAHGALKALEEAQAEFPGDPELAEQENLAREGIERAAEAQRLLAEGQELCEQRCFQEGLAALRRAYELDRGNLAARSALLGALVQQAKLLADQDWQAAEPLVLEALELDPNDLAAKSLQALLADRKRAQEVRQCITQVRQLRAARDLRSALERIERTLSTHQRDPWLVQLREVLVRELQEAERQESLRADLEELQRLAQELDLGGAAPPILEKARTLQARHPGQAEVQQAFQALERKAAEARGEVRRPSAALPCGPIEPLPPPPGGAHHENVQFTVYRPRVVHPQRWYPLLAFAHLAERPPDARPEDPEPIEEVQRQALQILGERAAGFQELTQDSAQPVPQEGEITFVPEIAGVEFNPSRQSFLWKESVHREEFRLRASAELDGSVARGRLSVFLGSLIVAQIPLSLRVDSGAVRKVEEEPYESSGAPLFRKIFASYSHKDINIVGEFERYARAIGDQYLRDVTHLRSGEVWDERLREMIRQAQVFQLFWSWNSIRSRFVENEWRYALALKRPHFIRPVYWEDPLPAIPQEHLPPEELLRLHFQWIPAAAPSEMRAAAAAAGAGEASVRFSASAAFPRAGYPPAAVPASPPPEPAVLPPPPPPERAPTPERVPCGIAASSSSASRTQAARRPLKTASGRLGELVGALRRILLAWWKRPRLAWWPHFRLALRKPLRPAWWIAAASVALVLIAVVAFLLLRPQQPAVAMIPVEVRTNPPGAAIHVGDKSQGASNLTLHLAPGTYELRAELEGYQPAVIPLQVQAGAATPVEISLTPWPQTLRIVSNLSAFQVTLDDQPPQDLKGGQFTLENLPPGKHLLKVASSSGEASLEFEIVPGWAPTLTSPISTKQWTALAVSGSAARARIFASANMRISMDGQDAGEAGPLGLELPGATPGTHELAVGEGRARRPFPVELGPAPALTLLLHSERRTGTLLVETGEPGVTVFLDGKPYGKTTEKGQLRITQEPGERRVRVAKEGFLEEPEQVAQIGEGAVTRLPFTMRPIPKPAFFAIHGATPGAEISVDHKPLGTVGQDGTLPSAKVDPGRRLIEARKDKHEPKRVEHTFAAGDSVTFERGEFELRFLYGKLELTVSPAGAVVTLTRAGQTQARGVTAPVTELEEGSYTLLARARDCREHSEEVNIKGGATVPVKIALSCRQAPPPPATHGMEGWDRRWTPDGDWFVQRGAGLILYREALGGGTYTFTARWISPRRMGGLRSGKPFEWLIVDLRKDSRQLIFRIGRQSFQRIADRAGRQAKHEIPHRLSLEDPIEVTLQVQVTPSGVTTRVWSKGRWVMLDDYKSDKGHDPTVGRLGFRIDGNDEIRLHKDFSFVPAQ